ncbi:hypothetical protein K5688_001493 [Campylobacter lari]|nr:hypothetical protein [Campylobacter lari]
MNNAKDLEIFELCEKLAELLGDKEAIADLKKLYANHPEMFKDMQEVAKTIKEVVKKPELIIKNPRPKVVTGEAVHSLHTSRPAELGGNNQKLSGANAHSATTKKIISQENKSKAYFQEKLNNFNHIASKDKELEK